jgi:GNAT superfamily N-acetyltransferase
VEVGTVFVHPDYQGKGIGNSLLEAIMKHLKNIGLTEFCLDSGYGSAQQIWKRKFGLPDYWQKDFWGEGQDHMVWRITFKEWFDAR